MNPASKIISALGGPTAVAKVVGIHRVRVSYWQVPREKGGTGGVIPPRHIPALLTAAYAQGVDLKLSDFFTGVPEVDRYERRGRNRPNRAAA